MPMADAKTQSKGSDVKNFSNIHYRDYEPNIWLLAMYLRDRISEEAPVKHFLPMAVECWEFMHNENNLERLDNE